MTTDDERHIERLVEELRAAGVRHLVATMVDSGSITRVKCFSLEDLASFVRSGSGFSILWALVLSNDHFTTTEAIKGPVGDIRMLPDPAAVVQLAATPEWAWAPMDLYDQEGAPLSLCPRGLPQADDGTGGRERLRRAHGLRARVVPRLRPRMTTPPCLCTAAPATAPTPGL